MIPLTAVALGLIGGLGFLLVLQGFRGKIILPTLVDIAPNTRPEIALAWFAAALLGALLAFAVTGWPVLAVAVFAAIGLAYKARSTADRAEYVARTEAIAAWAEHIRDTMAGAAGLEQALLAAAAHTPAPIAPEIRRFADRLDRMSLIEALSLLGEDLQHPSADLIVVSLINAAKSEARELGPLLTRLAESIRGDVRMRLRVEVGRTRIRTSARIVVAVTAATAALLFVFSRNLVAAYDTLEGQVWLLVVLGVFALGGWLLRFYGRIEMPERFTARRYPNTVSGGRVGLQ